MGKVLLSTGAYAKTPYYLEGLGVRVYSAEELCYVLKEDAFFLDRSIVDRKLIRWIEEELMLPKLAAALYPLLQKKTDPGTFAGIILQYVHLYENDIIKKTEAVYREGAGLSPFEKQKNRVDHLLSDGRYRTAVREYDKLLKELPEEEKLLSTAIYHNKGVVFSRLFWYEKAAEMFEEAYRRNGEEEELTAFLTAKRMQLPEKEYVAFVTGSPDYYEASMQLEQRLEKAAEDWQQSEEKRNTEELLFKRQTEEASYYYSEMAKNIESLQEEYRAHVAL